MSADSRWPRRLRCDFKLLWQTAARRDIQRKVRMSGRGRRESKFCTMFGICQLGDRLGLDLESASAFRRTRGDPEESY